MTIRARYMILLLLAAPLLADAPDSTKVGGSTKVTQDTPVQNLAQQQAQMTDQLKQIKALLIKRLELAQPDTAASGNKCDSLAISKPDSVIALSDTLHAQQDAGREPSRR